MSGNLGRDKVWNDQIWSEIDKAVREEIGRIRVAQKVFPCAILYNVQAVPFKYSLCLVASCFKNRKILSKPLIEMSMRLPDSSASR